MDGLDEQRLLGAAAAHLGEDLVLEDELRPALRALLSSLREDAELSPMGAWRASARSMAALSRRAALRRFEAQTQGLREADDRFEIAAPIFITGLARSSSHLLHNLLARTGRLWAPRLWELHEPVAPSRITERWIDRQIRATEAMLEQLEPPDEAAPELHRPDLHRATAPDECGWLLRNSFASLASALQYFVPGYVAFMRDASLDAAYRDHRRWLRVLAWRHRHDDLAGPRMVLSDPWHMAQLDALFAVYPNARVIQIHEELDELVPALARACWLRQRVDARRVQSCDAIAGYCRGLLEQTLEANAAARERLGPHRFVDLEHRAVLDDPIAVVHDVSRRLGLPCTEQALRDAKRWLLTNRFAPPVAQPRASAISTSSQASRSSSMRAKLGATNSSGW